MILDITYKIQQWYNQNFSFEFNFHFSSYLQIKKRWLYSSNNFFFYIIHGFNLYNENSLIWLHALGIRIKILSQNHSTSYLPTPVSHLALLLFLHSSCFIYISNRDSRGGAFRNSRTSITDNSLYRWPESSLRTHLQKYALDMPASINHHPKESLPEYQRHPWQVEDRALLVISRNLQSYFHKIKWSLAKNGMARGQRLSKSIINGKITKSIIWLCWVCKFILKI